MDANVQDAGPYGRFAQTENWVVLDRALKELIKNQDLQETTAHEYVVGYLCQALAEPEARPKASREEMLQVIRALRADIQAANPTNRDLEAELIAERREEAARE